MAEIVKAQKQADITELVMNRISDLTARGMLQVPTNYSAANALKAAWLVLQNSSDKNKPPILATCTQASIANALLNMVILGLNPAKNQCYFIPYGKECTLQRSYFGAIAVAKAANHDVLHISAEVIRKGQKFSYSRSKGKTVVTEHSQTLTDAVQPIIGAYCTVIYSDGSEDNTIMTFDEIKKSWTKSPAKPVNDDGTLKVGSTHEQFTAEMCKRTVINRACKSIINSSSDSDLLCSVWNEVQEAAAEAETEAKIDDEANSILLDFDEETGEVEAADEY